MTFSTPAELARIIDHTLLKPDAGPGEFEKLCAEAAAYGFGAVVVNSSAVSLCKNLLKGTGCKVGSVVSFPLGQTAIETKVFETKQAIKDGADEIDYVINIAELKRGNYDYLEQEMDDILSACSRKNIVSKVIFENCYLTDDEKLFLCRLANDYRPDFVKTSTGFGPGGATAADVALMRGECVPAVKVKASGGIRDLAALTLMAEAGAERIGTSAGVKIMEEYKLAEMEASCQ